MRASRVAAMVWSAVIILTALRAFFDGRLPMTGDEAYYWEWSRRLAAGYVDHPPAVALAVAAFSWLGRSPFAVRLPFVLCGFGTALATAGAAHILSGDRRAGWIAAIAVTLSPAMIIAFGVVSPDGPFALAWACSLYCAARAFRDRSWVWFAWLGASLGAALLSRFFGVALLAGVVTAALGPRYRTARPQLALSIALAIALWLPFLLWNASHQWISFTFSLVQRHQAQAQLLRPLLVYAECALEFSPGLWIAATIIALRPKEPLIAWTATPLAVVLLLLAFRETVEVYWFIGPFLSLTAGAAASFVTWDAPSRVRRGWWIFAPAAVLASIVFFAGIAPGAVYDGVRRAGLKLNNGGPFEVFTYPALARDVHRIAAARGAYVMTDGYGFSSVLDFYGDMQPVLIGYDAQGQEARRWFSDADRPSIALFVDKAALERRPDFQLQLWLACGRMRAGPILSYPLAGNDRSVPARKYYTTWCEAMKPGAVSTLRWENPVKP